MKTLFIVSSGLNKKSDEMIRKLEAENKVPRTSLLETELNTQLLDERYLNNLSGIRRKIYQWLPTNLSQLIEAWRIHKNFDAVISYYERVSLPFSYLQRLFNSKTPHILLTTWFSSRLKSWFLKRIPQHITKIITWSSNQYQYAIDKLSIPPRNIKLIKRGVDQLFWKPVESQTNTICSAGMEMRDYPTLIRALKSLEIPCHIATGEARGQLFNTVKDLYSMDDIPAHITIGEKNPTELRQLYAQSRFVVIPLLPTDTDNGLTVILEAMAMGKPVICSKVDGQIDVIKDGITGFYVPQGDPEALKKAIQYLWNDPDRAKQMGEAARNHIEKYHTVEQFVEAIKQEVSEALVTDTQKEPDYVLEKIEV